MRRPPAPVSASLTRRPGRWLALAALTGTFLVGSGEAAALPGAVSNVPLKLLCESTPPSILVSFPDPTPLLAARLAPPARRPPLCSPHATDPSCSVQDPVDGDAPIPPR